MPRFAASVPALSALVALEVCPAGMRLSELARANGSSTSTTQRAVELLAAEGLIERHGYRYHATDGPRTQAAIGLAMAFLPHDALVRALSASAAVEVVGLDPGGAILITRRFPEPRDEARLRRALDTVRSARSDLPVEMIAHHELAVRILGNRVLAKRIRTMQVVAGVVPPVLAGGRDPRAGSPEPLGHLNPTVSAPDIELMQRFARTHGLRRVVAFGSAVRGDLQPASDVDLLVEPAPGARPSLFELSAMTADAETLFGRDVDIVVGPARGNGLRSAIEREGVVLFDAG